MTTTKFKVDIKKFGFQNAALLRMIGKHNGGEVPTSLPDLISFESHQKALDNAKDFTIERDEEDKNILNVSEDGGKTFTLTIEEIEIHELEEVQ